MIQIAASGSLAALQIVGKQARGGRLASLFPENHWRQRCPLLYFERN